MSDHFLGPFWGPARIGLALAMLLWIDVEGLVRIGWEAWGGVAVLALAGASSVAWPTRPSTGPASRVSGLVGLAGVALAAGGLARVASPFSLIAILALGLLALVPARDARERGVAIAMVVAMLALGFLWVGSSTPSRIAQVGAALALGAYLAGAPSSSEMGWLGRGLITLLGVAAAAWALA